MTIRVVLTALFLAVSCTAQTPTSKPDLAARIQRIEDQQEIQRLLTDYGRLLDAHDFAGYSRLFAHDGEWSDATANSD